MLKQIFRSCSLLLLASVVLSACSDDKEKEIAKSFTVYTLAEGVDDNYEGLPLQVGLEGDTQPFALGTIDSKGEAHLSIDMLQYAEKNLWFCIPKVAKFFHRLSAAEALARQITLPDKEAGSTLDATGLGNDWIVALYMGVDKDGVAGQEPIYWATGNLIAVKTNGAGDGATQAAFHIASAEESRLEAQQSSPFVGQDSRLVADVTDAYAALPQGSRWDLYGFGDASGLMLYNNLNAYVAATGQKDGDIIAYDVSGAARFDIARAQLGSTWRVPTGGFGPHNEFAAFEDSSEEYATLLPNASVWEENGASYGLEYVYTVEANGRRVTTNTLRLPATGYRHAASFAGGRGKSLWYWSATADPTATPPYVPQGTYEGTVDETTTAFNYGAFAAKPRWYPHPRTSGQAIRPVTE